MSENDLSPAASYERSSMSTQHRDLHVNKDTGVESWFLKLIDHFMEGLGSLDNRVYLL